MVYKKLTEEHKEKIRQAIKRRWAEGKQPAVKKCPICSSYLGKNHSCESIKQKQRQAKLDNPTRYWLGKHRSKETRDKISENNKGKIVSKGENNPCWIGGSSKWWHKRAREIMEKYLERKLELGECVHHINENWKDNRLENLMIVSRSEHIKIHKPMRNY